jgi:DNA-binding MarR family transcriptional regulator
MSDKNLFETTFESLPSEDHRMRTWLALVGCFTSVERSLRRRLNRVFGSSLPRYDVLTALVQFPDGLTMGQLASRLMVSKGNITGVVGRLQEHRFVRQATSRTDRRVQVVTLTAKGRELWDQMHAEYRAVIDELLSPLSKAQAKALTQSLIQAQEKMDCVLRQAEKPR